MKLGCGVWVGIDIASRSVAGVKCAWEGVSFFLYRLPCVFCHMRGSGNK